MFTSIKHIALIFILALSACVDKNNERETIVIDTPSGQPAVFSVAIADTPQKKQKGLMFVDYMPEDAGMLFLYPQPQITKFWMKNTLIPLDILFFDAMGILRHIEHSAVPHDETPRGPDSLICSVVEINSGLAKQMNIVEGSKLITNLTQECLQSPNN